MKQNSHPSRTYMLAAIEQAKLAANGHFGVGAVIVQNHHIIAQANAASKNYHDPNNHAPIQAIKLATEFLNTNQLNDCVIYSTLEFCPMCATSIVAAKMGGAVFGTSLQEAQEINEQARFKYIGELLNIPALSIIENSPYEIFVAPGFMKPECHQLILAH